MDAASFALLLAQIVGVNLVLSADNAVVIALAVRSLPRAQQKIGIVIGGTAAITLRIVLTVAALALLQLPYVKLAGAVLLLWIASKLAASDENAARGVPVATTLVSAVAAIVLADLAMSLDNVLAVAAAAQGNVVALAIGLALSIPVVVLGSALLVRWMERWPVVVTLGAALIGWIAGELLIGEPVIRAWIETHADLLRWIVPPAAALAVVAIGSALAARKRRTPAREPVR